MTGMKIIAENNSPKKRAHIGPKNQMWDSTFI
jgi:hypothetical protein